MTRRALFAMLSVLLCFCLPLHGQIPSDDAEVDDLAIKDLSPQSALLSWKATPGIPCVTKVTYSVFRGADGNFEPSTKNMIASGLSTTRYTVHEQSSTADSYYHVRAVWIPISCPTSPVRPPPVKPLALKDAHSMGVTFDPVLSDEKRPALFDLSTSWIPTQDSTHGLFRYRVTARKGYNNLPNGSSADSEEPLFLKKLHACSFTLILQDKGGFDVGRFPLVFQSTVDDNGKVISLLANDSAPMVLETFRDLIAQRMGDGWNVSWTCP